MSALTVTGADLDGQTVGLRAEDGLIAEIGPGVKPKKGDEEIDGSGLRLAPPLVNGHTHAAMTLFRGFGDDLPLMEWLEEWIWPAEAKLVPEDVHWGARLACIEMIRSGVGRSSTCTGMRPRRRGRRRRWGCGWSRPPRS